MFVLQDAPTPFWLDVADGIRLEMRPVGTEALNAGRHAVRMAYMQSDAADVTFAFLSGVVRWGVIRWEGIGDASGAELPATPDAVHRLIQQRPDIYGVLDRDYVQPLLELLDEKKGSAPSPNGISEEGQSIAPPARKGRTRPKTAKPVRTVKTPA